MENNHEHKRHFEVSPGVWGMKDTFVNIYMVEDAETANWFLVDTGLKWSYGAIKKMAKEIFGDRPPHCIILTHGHFDHTGSVKKLATHYKVPVYAHTMELPYLTGQSKYPPPDPSVGGGMMSAMSVLYPSSAPDLSGFIKPLPEHDIPGSLKWKYIHTPGHSPGHISLYNQSENIVIAGDAVVTTKAESLMATIFQTPLLSGPSKYFTYDWEQSRRSMKSIIDLAPKVIASGHGTPMKGEGVLQKLIELYNQFDILAVPANGRYVNEAAITDMNGTRWIPPSKHKKMETALQTLAFAAVSLAFIVFFTKKKKKARTVQWHSFPGQFLPVK